MLSIVTDCFALSFNLKWDHAQKHHFDQHVLARMSMVGVVYEAIF